MHVFDIDIYTQTHTRAFKVQNLTSAKRFNQSRLDFLPELGYVYICYSILKPSNYVLSCTPSHTVNVRLTCVTAPMATSTPHELILTQTCWLIRYSIHSWQPMLERCRQSCFPPSLMAEMLAFNRMKLTCVGSEQQFIWVFFWDFFLQWDLKCFFVFGLLGSVVT